uniref:Unspecific monooxygenase n=1 Tax=Opuntia streptacantha TaxID=393608 RepID=A0A7C9EG21_OPUST
MHTNHMGHIEIFLLIFSLLFLFCYSFHKKVGLPTNWPFIGMLPAVLKNHHRIHDYAVDIMENSQLTFLVKGPWFSNMKLLVTADPANVHHVLSKNFGNYSKGPKFREIFEILGDGIFNADSEMWKYHRKLAQSVLAHPQFNQFLVGKTWEKLETGLIPILDNISKQGLEIDLQDLFGRFTFDTISAIVTDYDPGTLCIDLPDVPFFKSLHDGEESVLYRHVVPTCVWKFQRWLGIGQEKKYKEAWKIIDDFIYGCISKKREEMSKKSQSKACIVGKGLGIDLMTIYMDEVRDSAEIGSDGDKFLRDTILSIFSAGQSTTSVALAWFFYLLSKKSACAIQNQRRT